MGLFDKFFSLFKKKKDKEPPTDEKEKNKPKEIEEISENIPKPEPEPEVDKMYSPSTTPHESMETMPPSPEGSEADTMESRTTRTPMPSDDEEMEPNNDITEP